MEPNTQLGNAELATYYLTNIATAKGRNDMLKSHEELRIPIEMYKFAINGLDSIGNSASQQKRALEILKSHIAEKIADQGPEAFDIKDRQFAFEFVQGVTAKRNEALANAFRADIESPIARRHLLIDYPALTNAYYYYQKTEYFNMDQGLDPEVMSRLKNKMADQIEEKGPESFRPAESNFVKEPTR